MWKLDPKGGDGSISSTLPGDDRIFPRSLGKEIYHTSKRWFLVNSWVFSRHLLVVLTTGSLLWAPITGPLLSLLWDTSLFEVQRVQPGRSQIYSYFGAR